MKERSQPRVAGLFTAPAAGMPVESRAWVELVEGAGIAGDRYALKTGYWSDPRWPDQEVTLVESELAAELGIGPGALRRNIVTQGIVLAELIGREFVIGTARLRGVRPCTPCGYIEQLTVPGLLARLDGRGGLRAAILEGGSVRVGDAIEVVVAGV